MQRLWLGATRGLAPQDSSASLWRDGPPSAPDGSPWSSASHSSQGAGGHSGVVAPSLPSRPPPGWKPVPLGTAVRVPASAGVHSAPGRGPLHPVEVLDASAGAGEAEGQRWLFDSAFGPGASQDDVYDTVAGPVVNRVLDGYNGAVLAYGQTGTGKSHTMGILSRVESEGAGIIPRALSHCFGHVHSHPSHAFGVSVQFLQVYLDAVFDLLPPAADDTLRPLSVRESADRGFYAPDAGEWTVGSYAEAVAAINEGLERRVLGETRMNATSSRSHTLLMVTVRNARPGGATSIGRLTLVDLAGSERVARTASTGARLDEARAINSSLAALGNVIAKLSDAAKTRGKAPADVHVPFRDSKLTKLLSRCLGGNAETCVIATIGPMAIDLTETLSTLKFAERCMRVAAAPVRSLTASAASASMADLHDLAAEAARRAVAEAETKWRRQAEELKAEYEKRLAAVVSASAIGHNLELAKKASGLASRIIEAARAGGAAHAGADLDFDGVSSMLDAAARAIEPLLATRPSDADSEAGSRRQLATAAAAAAAAAAGASSAPPGHAAGEEDSGAHQALLLRYLLETNAKLMGHPADADSVASRPPLILDAASPAGPAGVDALDDLRSPPSPVPERVVAERRGERGGTEYRLRWRGEGPGADEWFDEEALLEECPELVKAFRGAGARP